MILQIKYFPSNTVIAKTVDFTASESFMDIKNLAVKIESPIKLTFTPYNGSSYNYIDYNGNRYYLFIDPTTKDDNKAEKFTYDINFKGFEYVLKLIPFNDIVRAGGNIKYTNSGIVSFYGGSTTIAQFLNANIEQYFGNKTILQIVDDFSDAFNPTMYPDQYFSFINQNCWDAVKSIKDILGINYFIDTSINGLSKIRITDKTKTLPYVFRQGNGDGLYSIGKTISNEDDILTVIRPYGGNRNIRPGYKKQSKPIDESRYSPYLLLPDLDGFLQYEIRKEEAIKKYGVRVKSVSDPFQGIFPSIQNATLGDVYGVPLPSFGNDGISLVGLSATDRIDRIVGSDFNSESKFFTVYVTDIGFDLEKKEGDKYVYYTPEDAVITMRTGLYAGQEFKIQQGKVSKISSDHAEYLKGARYAIVLERNEDGTDIEGKPILVPTESLSAGKFFAILGIYPPDVYYTIAERRLNIAATEWLNKYSVPQYTIPIDIAVSYFVEYPDEFNNFRAGNRLKVWGEDIDVNIESFTIQSYSLTYSKDNSYPKYNVTLSEVKEMGLLDRINAVSNSSSQSKSEQKYLGGGGAGGGTGLPEIEVTDKRYLRRDVPDVAGGLIDFQEGLNSHKKSIHEEGIQIGKRFVTGYVGGVGGYFDKDANGEIESLKIRTSLEVPTITFNNIDVISGDQVSTFSFGTFKEVDTENKIATLDLLDGERGTLHINDICRGVFHNIEGHNLEEDGEDENGFVNYAGFSTAYFTPVEIIENKPGLFRFRYALKAGTTIHPMVSMNFFGYGNFTDRNRQTITYTTRKYTRRLKNMNTWIINPDRNIAMQEGLLEGLNIGGMEMHGYGTYSENNYFTGTQIQFTPEQESDLAGKDAYNVVLSTYESSIVVDNEDLIPELTEEKDVFVGDTQVVTGIKDVVITSYKLNTLIQASKGGKPLFNSDVYQEGGYVVSLRPVGCVASISGGIVDVTSILDVKECYVEILVNCEGTVLFEKVFSINVIVNGSSNVIADIDNEMSSVACDQNGAVLFGLPLSTNVSLWYGTEELIISKVVINAPSGVTANYTITKGAKITVTGITQAAASVLNIEIVITGAFNNVSYTKTLVFTISKVKQGENAVLYELTPSVTSIKLNKYNNTTPTTIYCGLTKTDGSSGVSNISSIPSGYNMKYNIDNGTTYTYSINSTIPATGANINVTFYLYYGSILIDRETIPVIIDGIDGKPGNPGTPGTPGDDGTSPTRFWLVSTVEQIGIGSAGGLEPSSFLVYSKFQTGAGAIGDNAAYYILLFRTNNKASWSFVNSVKGSSMIVTPSASYKYYRICLATEYTTSTNSSYIIDAKDASIIENGQTGSMPRYRGIYKGGTTYVWNSEYRDIVNVLSGSSYATYQVATYGQSFSNVTPPNASYWNSANQFDFVAMNTALIEGANIAGFTFRNNRMESTEPGGAKSLILDGSTGTLTAKNANISGTITSSNVNIDGGTIGAFKISEGQLISTDGSYFNLSYGLTHIKMGPNIVPAVGAGNTGVMSIKNGIDNYGEPEFGFFNTNTALKCIAQGSDINYIIKGLYFDTGVCGLLFRHYGGDAEWLYRPTLHMNRMPGISHINTINNTGKKYAVGWDEATGYFYIY